MPDILLGFGGNLGDAAGAISAAIAELPRRGVTMRAVSGFYRTKPWGPVAQPAFVNACALGATELTPNDLLAVTQSLEREGGRLPSERWGPRALDIDILAYGEMTLATPEMTLPHPSMTERAFVLVPLAEIAPDWVIEGRRVREWVTAVDRRGAKLLPNNYSSRIF